MQFHSERPSEQVFIQVTSSIGERKTYPFTQAEMKIGYRLDCDLVLKGEGVSGNHCILSFQNGNLCIRDCGSTNGTFVNRQRCDRENRPINEDEQIIVGTFILEIKRVIQSQPSPQQSSLFRRPTVGSLLRTSQADKEWQKKYQKLSAWAQRWKSEKYARRSLLKGKDLATWREWWARNEKHAPTDSQIVSAFIAASVRTQKKRWYGMTGGIFACLGILAGLGYYQLRPKPVDCDNFEDLGVERPEHCPPDGVEPPPPLPPPPPIKSDVEIRLIEHQVIPAETIEDIAARYGTTADLICSRNGLLVDRPNLSVGQILKINATKFPLPQQRIEYTLDPGEDSWEKLSKRFDVTITKLMAYNPDIKAPIAGQKIIVWIDQKPLRRRVSPVQIPEKYIREDAISIGNPNDGKLENAIQLPDSDLYHRRNPAIMYGSGHTVKHLQRALVNFRHKYEFEGNIMIMDMSKKNGGVFRPHRSHQSGRDVDIWLPTLKGVYKKGQTGRRSCADLSLEYLREQVEIQLPTHALGVSETEEEGRDQRPCPDEVDWFATWGLIESLLETNEVLEIFLVTPLQKKVRQAAEQMGVPEEHIKEIGFDRKVIHVNHHDRHIHVRFKCGPKEDQCIQNVARGGDESSGDQLFNIPNWAD